MSEKEFQRWMQFHSEEPLGDTENFQIPIAALRSDLININQSSNAQPKTIKDMIIFGIKDDDDIEQRLLKEDW